MLAVTRRTSASRRARRTPCCRHDSFASPRQAARLTVAYDAAGTPASPSTRRLPGLLAGSMMRRDCLMAVQLGPMGVQLGGKVIWAGLRGCGCSAGTAGQQREDVTVPP